MFEQQIGSLPGNVNQDAMVRKSHEVVYLLSIFSCCKIRISNPENGAHHVNNCNYSTAPNKIININTHKNNDVKIAKALVTTTANGDKTCSRKNDDGSQNNDAVRSVL